MQPKITHRGTEESSLTSSIMMPPSAHALLHPQHEKLAQHEWAGNRMHQICLPATYLVLQTTRLLHTKYCFAPAKHPSLAEESECLCDRPDFLVQLAEIQQRSPIHFALAAAGSLPETTDPCECVGCWVTRECRRLLFFLSHHSLRSVLRDAMRRECSW